MSELVSSPLRGCPRPETWIALLGRRDTPTDGIEDYCTFLGRALATRGIELKLTRVPWTDGGWVRALRQLSRECGAWRGRCVLMQYTAFMWSRRGFPVGALIVLALLRRGGARAVVVFHEPCCQSGARWIDRVRGACQDWVIHRLYQGAAKGIFTVPLQTITWLPKGERKGAFIPIGANIPECVNRRPAPLLADKEKTVIVFGVTEPPNAAREVKEIASVIREASKALAKLRLVVIGRGSVEAEEPLSKALEGCNVDVVVRGVLPAEEIAREFECADALLFVRGALTSRRGSAMAGIASGTPIIGYRDGSYCGPLEDAGVEVSPSRDMHSLAHGLVRVLSDPARWTELHERSLEVQRSHLSWNRIAEQFRTVLAK